MTHADTARLDFLLKFLRIDNIGDDRYVPGVIVSDYELSEALTWATSGENGEPLPDLNLRRIIDQAIYDQAPRKEK